MSDCTVAKMDSMCVEAYETLNESFYNMRCFIVCTRSLFIIPFVVLVRDLPFSKVGFVTSVCKRPH